MNEDLKKISLKILYAHFILILLLVVEYFTYSYTGDDIGEIIKLVIPMSALYTTAALKFITDKSSMITSTSSFNSEFVVFARRVIYGHYLLIFFIVIAGGFNWISLTMITNGLLLIESLFGIFSGFLSNQLFEIKKD